MAGCCEPRLSTATAIDRILAHWLNLPSLRSPDWIEADGARWSTSVPATNARRQMRMPRHGSRLARFASDECVLVRGEEPAGYTRAPRPHGHVRTQQKPILGPWPTAGMVTFVVEFHGERFFATL